MAMYDSRKVKNKVAPDEPYNSDAERAVLGAALTLKEAVVEIVSSLDEDDFFEARHKIIFRAILNLFNRKIAADLVTVTEELINLKELENIGNVKYLQECAQTMANMSNINFYIDIVRNESVLRNMLNTIRDIDQAYKKNEVDNINDFIIQSELAFKKSIEKRKVENFKTTQEVATKVKNEMELMAAREMDAEDRNLVGIDTGFPKLNELTLGFQPQQLVILAGRPGLGKTAFALNIAFRASRNEDRPIAIFSLEMSSEQLVRRLIAMQSCVDLKNITTANLSPKDRGLVREAVNVVGNTKLFIDDTPGLRLTDIVAKSKKLVAEHPDLAMIVIDYLGLITLGGKSTDSRQEEVRKISLALKDLARELKIPVLCLSQLSREVDKRDNKKPVMSDLRDSGSIEQDADIILLMYRGDYYTQDEKGTEYKAAANKKGGQLTEEDKARLAKTEKSRQLLASKPGNTSYVEINVAKNRSGQVGKVGLFFFKSYGRFDVPSKEWEDAMQQLEESGGSAD